MSLTGREKAALRAEAHHLTAIVHVGKEGFTRTLLQSLDDALRTHELVKVQLGKTLELPARDAAGSLAKDSGAEVTKLLV